jgi:FtsP/CotA-like multicopper oxidase with cupredoxin domain
VTGCGHDGALHPAARAPEAARPGRPARLRGGRRRLGHGAAISARGGDPPSGGPDGAPLVAPPEVSSHDGLLSLTLPIAPGTVRIGGRTARTALFAGRFVPPTLRVRPGDRIRLRLVNLFGQPVNFHFHGFNVSPRGHGDDVLIEIPPHSTYRLAVRLPTDHPTGLY